MSIVLCGIRYLFGKNYHVKICQKNLEKIGESRNIDKCRPLWNSTARGFCQHFFFDKKMEIVSNFHFLTWTSNFRKSLQLLSFFQIFPYLPNFHIPNIPIFHVSKFLQFWNKRPLLLFR